MGALLDAIMGQQYKPTDNAYGIGAAGVVEALPYLNNPYASTGRNALYTLGGTLLGGILASYARREADTQNANLFKTALSMRTMTPDALQSAVESESRLVPYATELLEQQQLQELANQQADAANKRDIDKAITIEKVKGWYENPWKAKIAQDFQNGNSAALPEATITNQTANETTGQELAKVLQSLGSNKAAENADTANADKYSQLMMQYGGDEAAVREVLKDELAQKRDLANKQFEAEQKALIQKENLRKEVDAYLTGQQPLIDQSYNNLQDLKTAVINSKETGDAFGLEDVFRSGKLQAQRLIGDEEAKKRIAARSDLQSLSTIAASEIKKLMKDTQMAGTEFEKYLQAVPGLDKTPEANLEIINRMERAHKVASQKQEFINKGATEGLTLAESLKAYDNFNKALPPFKGGEINPLREGLDFNSINTKDFLNSVPELKQNVSTSQKGDIQPLSAQADISPEQIQAAYNQLMSEASPLSDPLQQGNFLAQAVDSALLGKSKYLLAPLDTLYEEGKDLFGLGENKSIGENLSASVDRLGAGLKAGEKLYPKSSTVADITGAFISPANKIMKTGEAVSTVGKLLNVGKRAAGAAAIAGVQAAGESNIQNAAQTGALISTGLDMLGGAVGKAAKYAPAILNKAYGIFKSDYNAVAKNFSAKDLDKIKGSVDNGIGIIEKEAGITAKEAFKTNEDFYTDMFKKSEELIAKRTNLVDDIVRDVGAVSGKIKLNTSQIVRGITNILPEEKPDVIKQVNKIVSAANKTKPEGFSLQEINDLKRLYNPRYNYNPKTAEEVAYKGVIDHLRGKVENTIENLIPKKVDSSLKGVISGLNSQIKDLINVQNIYAKKIPGARAEDVLSSVRQAAYTTSGAGTQGARNIGEALAGEVGGKIGTATALATYTNRLNRPVLQSFIKNQQGIRDALGGQAARTAITQETSRPQKDYSGMFKENQQPKKSYDELFNTRSSLQSMQARTAPPAQSVSPLQSQTYNNTASTPTSNQPVKEIKAFTQKLPPLIQAVIKTESNYNPQAVSNAGAKGLMQIMPEHYQRLGVNNPFDPIQNIKAGATILQEEIDRFQNLPLALAAYNSGAPTVLAAMKKANSKSFTQIAKYLPSETQSYVRKVLNNMSQIRSV